MNMHLNIKKDIDMSKSWTPNQILKLYRSIKTKTALLNEEGKTIPLASREKRGAYDVRVWHNEDLPEIGKKFGFLKQPKDKKIIVVNSQKGGVLKSTIAYQLARVLAIHGIKTLGIGLEVAQRSFTLYMQPPLIDEDNDDIEQIEAMLNKPVYGLYHLATGENSFEEVIQNTDLPTLDYIPETPELQLLENKIMHEVKRELYLDRLLAPIKDNYDVIILDTSAYFNSLFVQNALTMATDIIYPIGCKMGDYSTVATTISQVNEFKNKVQPNWNSFSIVPVNLKMNSKNSKYFNNLIRATFKDSVTAGSIRVDETTADDATMDDISVIEHKPTSPLASDYYNIFYELWNEKISS